MGSGDTIGLVDNSHKNLLSQNIENNSLIFESTAKESVINKIPDSAHCNNKEDLTGSNDKSKTLETGSDIAIELTKYRANNMNKIVLATLNINSIRNKFSSLAEIVSNNIDVLVIQETKLDATFPEGQFLIPGFKKPFRRDRDKHGGGILIYVRNDIPSREVKTFNIEGNTEGIFVELNFRKSKWLLLAAYKPPHVSKLNWFDNIIKALDFYGNKYENMILIGDLNTLDTDEVLSDFLEENFLHNLVNFPTCYKSTDNPSSNRFNNNK